MTRTSDGYVPTTILHFSNFIRFFFSKSLVFAPLVFFLCSMYKFMLICLFQKTMSKNHFSTLKDNKLKDKIDEQQIICVINKIPLQKYSPGFL